MPDETKTAPINDVTWIDRYRLKVTFDAVVSAWDNAVPCQVPTRGALCGRPARLRADMHGCQRLMMCTTHADGWKKMAAAAIAAKGSSDCPICCRKFTAVADACTFTEL